MNKKGAVLIGFLLSGALVAQDMMTPGLMPQASIRAGTSFQMWKVDPFSDPVTQISLPISMAFPLGRHFRVSLQQTPGFSWWQPEDDPLRLYGLSDTWVKGALLLWEDKLMLHAGMGLPTGRTRLDSTEYELVSKGTSRNVFRFSLPVYGQGFTGTTGFAFAFPVIERVVLGAGAYYIYRAPYYPLQYVYSYEGQGGVLEQGDLWNNKYKPGDEVSGHIGLDAQIGDHLRLMFDGLFTHYWRDMLDDSTEVFGSGDRVAFHLAAYYPFDENYLWSRISLRQRGKNEILQHGSLLLEDVNTNGFQLEWELISQVYQFTNGGFLVLGDFRYFEKDEQDPEGQDWTLGAGIGLDYRLNPTVKLDLRLKIFYGIMDWQRTRNLIGLDTYIGVVVDI